MALGLPPGTPAGAGREHVADLLELVGLTAFAGHRPREVSGGMAQRAALARALARSPWVLLLDEPFGALDALTRLRMQDLLMDVHAASPATVLLVTHDVDEAIQLADRVILLAREPGRPGATVRQIVTIPGDRPRDRGSAACSPPSSSQRCCRPSFRGCAWPSPKRGCSWSRLSSSRRRPAWGFLLVDSQNNGRVDRILLAIILLAVLGKTTDAILGIFERWAIRRWT